MTAVEHEAKEHMVTPISIHYVPVLRRAVGALLD